jgi:hypothetical protein
MEWILTIELSLVNSKAFGYDAGVATDYESSGGVSMERASEEQIKRQLQGSLPGPLKAIPNAVDFVRESEYEGPAIVDLMGRVRVAGHIREVTIAGAGFLRIDIPPVYGPRTVEIPDLPGNMLAPPQTLYQSPASIWGIEPATEEVVRRLASTFRREPASQWDFKEADIAAKVRSPEESGKHLKRSMDFSPEDDLFGDGGESDEDKDEEF